MADRKHERVGVLAHAVPFHGAKFPVFYREIGEFAAETDFRARIEQISAYVAND